MATRLNLIRLLCRRTLTPTKSTCRSMSLLIASACAVNSGSNSDNLTPLKLLDKKDMTHDALIRQACSLTAHSSTQLLTQVLVAINDTSVEYREAMAKLMGLLEESIVLLTNSSTISLDEVEELIVEQRNIVEEQRQLLHELISLMEYVDKTVTSTAETAFLAGAEHSSTMMCERLNSALNKVLEERAINKRSEDDLLMLQQAYVIKLGELYERQWNGAKSDGNQSTPSKDIVLHEVSPIEIFEGSLADEGDDKEECNPNIT